MNQSRLWKELHDLFDTDDGSLPEIELNCLSGVQVQSIYLFLRSRGKDTTRDGAKFWDNDLKQKRPVDSIANAATLVTTNRADPFHVVISGLTFNGVTVPDIGVFVFQESISLDYRMGVEWEPAKLSAYFECLFEVKKFAPSAKISLQPGTSEEAQKRFQKMLAEFIREKESGDI
jgi:hypothetical protein